MGTKQTDLREAIATVASGTLLGLGGNTLNRAPMAAVFELARQGQQNLRLVKTAGAMDIDLLCFSGQVASVDAGFVSYESQYSLAQHYRKGVQDGRVIAHEHACYTVISALRAASYGIGFMPVKGLQYTDLIAESDSFATLSDPFTGQPITVVKAIAPDVTILHVHLADERGNAYIEGPQYEDVLLAKAAKRLIITCERMVGESYFAAQEHKAQIPHFLVSHVVHCPRGAAPCALSGHYPPDGDAIQAFLALKNRGELEGYLAKHGRAQSW